MQDLSKVSASRRIEAPIVILAAGSLGTAELLLRVQQRGLNLSGKLGWKILRQSCIRVRPRRAGQCYCHELSTRHRGPRRYAPERVRAEQKVKAMIESMGGEFEGNPFAM
jgi:hypothetical protein